MGQRRHSPSRSEGATPPLRIDAEELFRILSTRSRPTIQLAYRLPFAPNTSLHVRALTGAEDASVFRGKSSVDELLAVDRAGALALMALVTPSGRAAISRDHVEELTSAEVTSLAMNIHGALDIISPVYWRHNVRLWRDKLKLGALQGSNLSQLLSIGSCVERGDGSITMRPDRYYGLPVCEITDAQLLAFDGGYLAYQELTQAKR